MDIHCHHVFWSSPDKTVTSWGSPVQKVGEAQFSGGGGGWVAFEDQRTGLLSSRQFPRLSRTSDDGGARRKRASRLLLNVCRGTRVGGGSPESGRV